MRVGPRPVVIIKKGHRQLARGVRIRGVPRLHAGDRSKDVPRYHPHDPLPADADSTAPDAWFQWSSGIYDWDNRPPSFEIMPRFGITQNVQAKLDPLGGYICYRISAPGVESYHSAASATWRPLSTAWSGPSPAPTKPSKAIELGMVDPLGAARLMQPSATTSGAHRRPRTLRPSRPHRLRLAHPHPDRPAQRTRRGRGPTPQRGI